MTMLTGLAEESHDKFQKYTVGVTVLKKVLVARTL